MNNYNNIRNNDNLVEDSCIKFSPGDFKKKYRKFVEELNVLMENLQLANQMIDFTEPGDKPDDGLRMIMLNLKGCEQNLSHAIQNQISDELLLEICLKVNDDLNQTSERYNLIKTGAQAPSFTSSFGWTTKTKSQPPKKEIKYEEKREERPKPQIQEKVEDPFDFFSSTNTQAVNNQSRIQPNNNTNSNPNQNKSTNLLDINDIISSFSNMDTNKQQPVETQPVFDFVSNKNNNPPKNNQNFDMFSNQNSQIQNQQSKPDISLLLNNMNSGGMMGNYPHNNNTMGMGYPGQGYQNPMYQNNIGINNPNPLGMGMGMGMGGGMNMQPMNMNPMSNMGNIGNQYPGHQQGIGETIILNKGSLNENNNNNRNVSQSVNVGGGNFNFTNPKPKNDLDGINPFN